MRSRFALLGVLACLLAVAPAPVRAEGVDAMGESYRATLVGGGVVSDGVGLARRNGGATSGTITISGVPAGAQVSRAFLYWSVLAGDDPAVQLAGQPVLGSQIGRSPDPCWYNVNDFDPAHDSRAYRADVTSIVPGNGSYSIGGVGGDAGLAGDGTGASLFVVYGEEEASFQTTIILNDGSITGGIPGQHRNVISHTFGSLPRTAPVLDAKLHVGIGDGQPEFFDGHMTLGDAEVLPPNSLNGSDGPSWDDTTLGVPASLFGAETMSLDNVIETVNDCVVWTYAALELQQDRSALPPPAVSIASPLNGAVLGTQNVTISGSSTGASSVRLTEGQQTFATVGVGPQGAWSAQIGLGDGTHSITATALDAGQLPVAAATVQFTVNTGGPPPGLVTVTSPAHNSVMTFTAVPFSGGSATGVAAVRLTEGAATLATAPVSGGTWSTQPLTFAEGAHDVWAVPLDSNGNQSGPGTNVQFGIDTSPPAVQMQEPEFPSPPGTNVQINIGNAAIRGYASDALAVSRVVVSYRPYPSLEDPRTVEANCGGCTPTFCMYCGNHNAEWWAEIGDLTGPGIYQITATAYDLTGRSATTPTRLLIEIFGNDGPGGLFGPDGPFGGEPPNCYGPLDGTPACFDPFGEGGPLGIFDPDSPLCVGPIKEMFCSS